MAQFTPQRAIRGRVQGPFGWRNAVIRTGSAKGLTFGARRRTFALPNLIQVVSAGELELYMRFGVGLARKEPFHVFTLTHPSRLVIDVNTPFRMTPVRDYFLNKHRFQAGHEPFTQPVSRPVIPPAVGFGALQRHSWRSSA